MFIFLDFQQFQKLLPFNQTMTCPHCGRFGRYEVVQISTRFRLFFIPLFTFGTRYLVRTTCCDTWYQLEKNKGRAIAKGEPVSIQPEDLVLYREGSPVTRLCPNCGAENTEGSLYCSQCGRPLP